MSIFNLLGAGKMGALTSFFSSAFFTLFLPIAILVFSIVPQKLKKYSLLAMSYAFFWLVSGKLLIYLLAATLSMLLFGLWIDHLQKKMKLALENLDKDKKKEVKKKYIKDQRCVVFLSVLVLLEMLLVLKYSGFIVGNINSLLDIMNIDFAIDVPALIMPIGISFFSLQAMSYIFDVYHGVTKADKNFFRLGLFISFFPQIVEGPICRYNQTAQKLWEVKKITFHNFTFGLQRFLYGMLKKIVIADRLNALVQEIFDKYQDYSGGIIAIGAICYTIQLYMDFSGSIDAVIGVAQIFGIDLPENFKRPFFSKTIWNSGRDGILLWARGLGITFSIQSQLQAE